MNDMDIGARRTHAQLRRALACAALLALAGCNGEESLDAGSGFTPAPDPAGPGTDDSSGLPGLPGLSAADLVRSSLEATSKLVVVSNIVNAMVHDHLDLVRNRDTEARNIAQCASSPDGYDFETNQVRYWHISAGQPMPEGDALRVALSQCLIEGVRISGFIDITAIDYNGDPAGSGDWDLEAEVWLSPAQIHNNNGTVTSLTDHYAHTVGRDLNVLGTTLEIGADADAGMIGGLNGQYYTPQVSADSPAVNFQFRPFRIETTEDPNAGEYLVEIANHSEGASTLSRYTNGADDEILLRIQTLPEQPLRWPGSRPVSYAQTPASGSVLFAETCLGCDSIQADVAPGGVILTLESEGAVTSEPASWSVLLSPPPPP